MPVGLKWYLNIEWYDVPEYNRIKGYVDTKEWKAQLNDLNDNAFYTSALSPMLPLAVMAG